MTMHAYIDGASRGNPGESGVGIILKNEEGQVLHAVGGYIGKTTNNVAEYTALIECLQRAQGFACTKLVVHSDSELLVKQIQGAYRVRNEGLRKYFQRVQRLKQTLPFSFEVHHVPREQNRDADMLANSGIDGKIRLRPFASAKHTVKKRAVREA